MCGPPGFWVCLPGSGCAGLPGSRCAGLGGCGSRAGAPELGLSCPETGGIFLDQELNPCLLHWQDDSKKQFKKKTEEVKIPKGREFFGPALTLHGTEGRLVQSGFCAREGCLGPSPGLPSCFLRRSGVD